MYDPFDLCHLGPIRKSKDQRNCVDQPFLTCPHMTLRQRSHVEKTFFFIPYLCNNGFGGSRRPTTAQLWRCNFVHISERWLVLYRNPMDANLGEYSCPSYRVAKFVFGGYQHRCGHTG